MRFAIDQEEINGNFTNQLVIQDAEQPDLFIENLTPILNAFGIKSNIQDESKPMYQSYESQAQPIYEYQDYPVHPSYVPQPNISSNRSPRRRRSRRRQQQYKRAPQYVVSQEFSLDYSPHIEDFW